MYTSQSVDDKLAWTFQFYDVDGNGRIEKAELQMAIEMMMMVRGEAAEADAGAGGGGGGGKASRHGGLGETAAQIAERIFRKMDVNNDGFLSEEEFVQGCLNDKKLYQLLVR